jgi:hypothetical protein
MSKTKYAKQHEATEADEVRTVTMEEARALPGLLGQIASAMLTAHGVYGFTDSATNRRILLKLA